MKYLFKINSVNNDRRKIIYCFFTVIVKPRDRNIKQHTRIQIGVIRILICVFVFKSCDKHFIQIGVGIFIALCALYILFAPKIRIIGREHNVFKINDSSKNKLAELSQGTAEILLCKSQIYGSFVYRATIKDGIADGNIERDKSLWKRMHVVWKIICCILSEILIFVWLIGRIILLFRSINLPQRLEYKMKNNGFEKVNV